MAALTRFKKLLIVSISLWFLMLFGLSRMFFVYDAESGSRGVDGTDTQRSLEKLLGRGVTNGELKKINSALEKIDKLQKQNDVLQKRLQQLRYRESEKTSDTLTDAARDNVIAASSEYLVPSQQFESRRRRLESGIVEFWRYASTHLKKLFEMKDVGESSKFAQEMLDFMTEHKRVILKDIAEVETAAGLTDWKNDKSKEMAALVQNRLHNLQNPKNCARRLRCSINKACGFGCQIHHATYCLIAAYALNRTVILESKGWRYSKKGWDSVFLPLSTTCSKDQSSTAKMWRDDAANAAEAVIELPIVDNIQGASGNNQRPKWLPLAVPQDLFSRIHMFHKNPPIWWLGQLISYLWRFQPATQDMLNDKTTKIGFASPIVGVHIRRTDKIGTEAARHEVDEYMKQVDEYYNQLEVTENKLVTRRIFLATDDANVFQECKKKYPKYEVLGDPYAMDSAALNKRYSDESLKGIITDIHFLSQSDHLVCTFSSQVCRLAYELMQARFPDATDRYNSLDDVYYYGGQNAHNFEAIMAHQARNAEEISFSKGDLLGIAGNHWDGISVAEHLPTNRKGKFPSYKADEHFVTVQMPRYADKTDL